MGEESSTFRLVAYAIFTVALIAAIMLYILPYFSTGEDVIKAMQENLKTAELNEGKLSTTEIKFENGTIVKGLVLDSATRGVNFVCTSPNICCETEENCKLKMSNRNLESTASQEVQATFRCVLELNLYKCKIYFGQEPAQLEIKNFDYLKKIDISSPAYVKIRIKNSGRTDAKDAIVSAKTFNKIFVQEELLKVLYLDKINKKIDLLKVNEEKEIIFELQLSETGKFEVELRAEAEDAGLAKKTIEIETFAQAATANCAAVGKEKAEIRNNECVAAYTCSDCSYGFECAAKWIEKGVYEQDIVERYAEKIYAKVSRMECE